MSGFHPSSLNRESFTPRKRLLLAGFIILVLLAAGLYFFLVPRAGSGRWAYFRALLLDRETFERYTIKPGTRCGEAPFAFPTTGAVIGLWDQSYRPGHRHSGIDIFPGTQPGVTPVFAAYSGYLTRLPEWQATVIIRIPSDPLNPDRQIWAYYTHMATSRGESFVSEEFPPGTFERFVEEGTLLGYQGDFSGDPANPTGLHLHFSIVKDDGEGDFLNELDIRNTYDPAPYFNLALNHNSNANAIPLCEEMIRVADWPALQAHD